MIVYGSIHVENNVDEGSLLQVVFSLGIKTICQVK